MRHPSRAKAVHQNCKDCIYDPAEPGTWRKQTEMCTITTCAVWEWRPVSKKHPKTAIPDTNDS